MTKNAAFGDSTYQQAHSALGRRDRYISAIIDFVKPTHFITLDFCQGRTIIGKHGIGTWAKGDDVIYSEAHRSFVQSLSKRTYSKSSWKRHKTLLRSAAVIEGGTDFVRNHLHMMIELPGTIDDLTIRQMIYQTGEKHSWIMNGEYGVNFQRIRNSSDVAYYCTKHGFSRATFT